jgi:hypothetical protein
MSIQQPISSSCLRLMILAFTRGTKYTPARVRCDGKFSPDLPRGRGKSIGRDLDIDDEGSEQNVKHLQSLYHNSIGYQLVCTQIDLAKKAYSSKRNQEHR